MDMLKQIERNEAHNNFFSAAERYCELEHQFMKDHKYPSVTTLDRALDAKKAMHEAYERYRGLMLE